MLKRLKFLFLVHFRSKINYFSDNYFSERIIKSWFSSKKTLPPPRAIKQQEIIKLRDKYNLEILIETGTYLGDMIAIQRNKFKKIFSIEISEKLYFAAKRRFKNYSNVELFHGDSSVVLPVIINKLDQSALFWLDGHYSAGITEKGELDCPIYCELDAILQSKFPHLILIDDARCFKGVGDYPTIDNLIKHLLQKREINMFEVKDDIIRILLRPVIN